jgi:hypothetical protein
LGVPFLGFPFLGFPFLGFPFLGFPFEELWKNLRQALNFWQPAVLHFSILFSRALLTFLVRVFIPWQFLLLAMKPFFAGARLLNFFRTHSLKTGQLDLPQLRPLLVELATLLHLSALISVGFFLPCADNKLQKIIKAKITKRGTFIV